MANTNLSLKTRRSNPELQNHRSSRKNRNSHENNDSKRFLLGNHNNSTSCIIQQTSMNITFLNSSSNCIKMIFFVLKLKAISRIFIQYVIRKFRVFKIINKMKNKLSVLLCNLFTLFLTSIIHGSLHNHNKFISQNKHIYIYIYIFTQTKSKNRLHIFQQCRTNLFRLF